MEIIGSLAALQAGEANGFVGYPQKYSVSANEKESFIEGVDQAGKPFKLFIDVPQVFVDAAKNQTDISVPSVATLAETHRRARNPCIAMNDNGPATCSGGVFLAEQVEAIDAEKGIYKSRWLSILKDWEDGLTPRIAVGYLETNVKLPFNAEVEGKKKQLIDMNAALAEAKKSGDVDQIDGIDLVDYTSSRDQLALELFGMAKKWFVGVDIQFRRLQVADMSNEALVRRVVLEMIESNTVNGMYGGVIMRPVKVEGGKRIVKLDSVRRLNHQYDYTNRCIPSVDTVWDAFVTKSGSGWLKAMKKEGYEVEIIPVQRINCGPISNEKYSKEYTKGNLPKQLKAFVDREFYNAPYVSFSLQNAFLATPIAIRMADTRGTEKNLILGSIHAFGKPFGNALELDQKMDATLKLSERPEPKVRSARQTSDLTI